MATIGLFVSNLMDRSRIRDHLQSKGHQVVGLATMEELIEFFENHPGAPVIAELVVFDQTVQLNHPAVQAAADRILGFFPHVRTDLLNKMKKAGIVRCYPRSKFFSSFDALLESFS